MFHNVLAVEHTLRYQAYSSTPYVTKLFINSAVVITLLILAFLNLIYYKLEVTVSRAVRKKFNIISSVPKFDQVPAGHRIFYFLLWETFCPLLVIFINKSYQKFAIKTIKGRIQLKFPSSTYYNFCCAF